MKLFLCIFVALVAQSLALPFEGRIIGGRPAARGQFPHQVSLQANGQHFCGGSILDEYNILTAAHCIYGNSGQITVVGGITSLNEGGQRVPVRQGYYHGNYDPNQIVNDVAILKLSGPLNLDGVNLKAIPLRTHGETSGETLTLSGWGLTSYPNGGIPRDLQCINLQALDLNTCASIMGSNPQMPPVTNGNVCTTSPRGEGACQGDSGGPLIDQQGQQIGVVSWGMPCALGKPDIFTSVPAFIDWIQQVVSLD